LQEFFMSTSLSDWRTKARTHRPHISDRGLPPTATNFYAAMRAMGETDIADFKQAVEAGLLKEAPPARSGARRIEIASLIEAGVPIHVIAEAERYYARQNRENYQRRKARQIARGDQQ
jgi:hypothetical protein